jgi:2',3'-cyclic-nucleotide 2'-phosphodiesterase (5'-nucleotidase family)
MARKVSRFLGGVGLVLGLAVFACAQTKTLTILHTNDTHSAMVPFESGTIPIVRPSALGGGPAAFGSWTLWRLPFLRDYAGIARMATLIKRYRMTDPNVLAVNTGDVFVGSFEFNKYLGYPEFKIMEGLYDVVELGNHEFDLGIDTLAAVLGGQLGDQGPVQIPILCANVDFSGTYASGLIQDTFIKTIGGIKVGFFGLVTQEPQNYSAEVNSRFPYPYEGEGKTLWERAGELAYGLKAQGCDVVVCLSHLGKSLDVAALSQVPFIDVIIGGHSHDAFAQPIIANGKIIVQAGAYGYYLGELKLRVGGGKVFLRSWNLHRTDASVREDPQVKVVVNQLKAGVVNDPRFGDVYGQTVAYDLREIPEMWPDNSQNRDSALGNLVTDAYVKGLKKAGIPVDCALDVMGYIAHGLPAGKIVGNDVLRAVPYGYDPTSGLDFKLVVVPMSPALLLGGLEYAADMVTLSADLGVQASGLTYSYDSTKPPAEFGSVSRIDLMSVMVNGEPVAAELGNPNKFYLVAMSEQVFRFLNDLVKATGGDLEPYTTATGLFEYNLVRDYMKSLRFVSYKSEGRIRDTGAAMSVQSTAKALEPIAKAAAASSSRSRIH